MTNKEFARSDKQFIYAVRSVNAQDPNVVHKPLLETKRQASKFRNKKGIAYKYRSV